MSSVLPAASPIARFYSPVSHETPDIRTSQAPEFRVSFEDPNIIIGDEKSRGNEIIGISQFEGPPVSRMSQIAQGKRVGATLVIHCEKQKQALNLGVRSDQDTGSLKVDMSAREGRDPKMLSQAVLFFRHGLRFGIGVLLRELNPAEHARIKTDAGIEVLQVVPKSPAASVDVLPGDIIISINETRIYLPQDIVSYIKESKGSILSIKLLRDERLITKTIPISKDGSW